MDPFAVEQMTVKEPIVMFLGGPMDGSVISRASRHSSVPTPPIGIRTTHRSRTTPPCSVNSRNPHQPVTSRPRESLPAASRARPNRTVWNFGASLPRPPPAGGLGAPGPFAGQTARKAPAGRFSIPPTHRARASRKAPANCPHTVGTVPDQDPSGAASALVGL